MRWILVVLIACDSGQAAPPDPPTPTIERHEVPPPVPKETPRATGTMHATWAKVRTTDSCWYFSGPDGRDNKLVGDAQLTRNGDQVTMVLGGATFGGTFKDGELHLARSTNHEFGTPWGVRESIRGPYREGAIIAKYHYEECERDTPCPNHCTIDADLTLALRAR